jgi:hypothetical protein
MAYGVVDLRAGVPADGFVAALRREMVADPDATHPVELWVDEHRDGLRITLIADRANTWLGGAVARAARDVERVLLGLDHDEYGVEHVVLDGRSGTLLRIHHVYVYPDGEATDEFGPLLADLPARPDLATNPDGTLTGADSLAAAAALYEVSAVDMVRAVHETADAHESLQIVFEPLAPWWRALGVAYPVPDLGDPTMTLGRPEA